MKASGTRRDADGIGLHTRLTWMLFLFALWCGLVVLRLAQYMLLDRERTVTAMARDSVYEGVVAADRGRILDREGRVLAWSERVYEVSWRIPSSPEDALREFGVLPAAAPGLVRSWAPEQILARCGQWVCLGTEFDAVQVLAFEPLRGSLAELDVRATFRRQRVENPEVTALLGRVVCTADGTEVGVSGLELLHDEILRGQPGIFRVTLDKHGKWIPETWTKLADLRRGYDVHLPLRSGTPAGSP
ncbi:MAG: hypothetical protein JXR77_03645 [Lentisphaeria bacterium]|nr:hypothetical protein [Lentisphaeria bacterium]